MAEKQNPVNDNEAARLKKEEQARKGRRRSRQLIGLALAVLIVVGAVSIIQSGYNLVQRMLDTTEEFEEYSARIETMVWFDPVPFESLAQADTTRLKSICLWGVLYEQQASLEKTENNDTLVPAASIDRYAASLFGPDFSFGGHATFEDDYQGMIYEYVPESQVYMVPPTSMTATYIPSVVDIQRESGGVLRVIVGYVSTTGSEGQFIDRPDLTHPVKYMDYMFRRDGNEYYLYALLSNTTYAATVSSVAEPPVSQASSFTGESSLSQASAAAATPPSAAGSSPSSVAEDSASASDGEEPEEDSSSDSSGSSESEA